jgi:transcriptional regulator with XRE-family HTH domain
MTFGQRLTEERLKKGLSKLDLSKIVEIHYSQIGRYERDQATPGSDMLKKLANALELTTDYLMNGTVSEQATDRIKDKKLITQFQKIAALPEESQVIVLALIDAFVFQQEMKDRFVNI